MRSGGMLTIPFILAKPDSLFGCCENPGEENSPGSLPPPGNSLIALTFLYYNLH